MLFSLVVFVVVVVVVVCCCVLFEVDAMCACVSADGIAILVVGWQSFRQLVAVVVAVSSSSPSVFFVVVSFVVRRLAS